MASMFPDEMGIGEEDKTVQLVLIYGSIAILYLAVAYIMFFRSILSFYPFLYFLSGQILRRKSPREAKKEDSAAKEGDAKNPKEGEEKKPKEEPKKDKKMKKKD